MRLRIPLPSLAAGLAACCATAATLLPTPALAAPGPSTSPAKSGKPAAAAPAVPKPAGADAAGATAATDAFGAPAAPLSAAQLSQAAVGRTPDTSSPGTGTPDAAKPAAPKAKAAAAGVDAQSCTAADFGSRSGAALVSFVQSSTTDCVSTLFNVTTADAASVFKQSQMLPVANAFKAQAASYTGDNSANFLQLVLFLRAGYYIQSNNASVVGPYDSTLTDAVKAGLDAFFATAHSRDVTDANGAVLKEVVTLTDSANLQAKYLTVYRRLLDGFDNSYNAVPQMVSAVNNVLRFPLWRGNWNTDFVSAVTADPGVISSTADFALNHKDLLTGANAVLVTNAGNDLGRIAGDGAAVEAVAKPQVKRVLDGAPILGSTGGLYVHTAYQANYYDGGQCSYYDTCNLPAKLTAVVLPNQLVCDNRTIQTQTLSAADLAAVCTSLRGEDGFFHNLVKDSGAVNPYGKTVTMGIFANKNDYTTYSWAIFNNSTDNGGQTVMDPTDPNNKPVTVMYLKSWNDSFPANVWNLNHEYTHYLDGIYDMKGNFGTQMSVPDIWWVEGVAEYESYAYRGLTDTDAMDQASKHTYKLSTIFQNTYGNSDSTRVYPWGYLAVRFMFEKHRADVDNMLTHFRAGDYQGGYAVYNSIGTGYDAEFDAWLSACAGGACFATGPTGLFDQSVSGGTVTLTDRSVQTGPGQITSWHWTFGDGSSSDERNPSHTYAAAGTYTVALTVTDSNGKSASTPASVTVATGGPITLPTCTDQRTDAMGQNCSRADRARTAGNLDYLYIYLPAGTSTLKVNTSGGTGTVALYYNESTWASPNAFTASSTNAGTTQSITVTNPTAGYRYLSLYAVTDFSGVTVSTQF